MSKKPIIPAHEILRRAVDVSGMKHHVIVSRYGTSDASFSQWLNGHRDVKYSDLTGLCEFLGQDMVDIILTLRKERELKL
jgi:hypothetical protein